MACVWTFDMSQTQKKDVSYGSEYLPTSAFAFNHYENKHSYDRQYKDHKHSDFRADEEKRRVGNIVSGLLRASATS
jgi:hypothetical protein